MPHQLSRRIFPKKSRGREAPRHLPARISRQLELGTLACFGSRGVAAAGNGGIAQTLQGRSDDIAEDLRGAGVALILQAAADCVPIHWSLPRYCSGPARSPETLLVSIVTAAVLLWTCKAPLTVLPSRVIAAVLLSTWRDPLITLPAQDEVPEPMRTEVPLLWNWRLPSIVVPHTWFVADPWERFESGGCP